VLNRTRLSRLVLLGALALMTTSPTMALGSITQFSTEGVGFPQRLTAGPDGNVWFTGYRQPEFSVTEGAAGKITPGGTITTYTAGLNSGSAPGKIIAGADGNLWFADRLSSQPAIGRVTPSGTITEFSFAVDQDGEPRGIGPDEEMVVGPDGNVWFSNPFPSSDDAGIGRVTPAGAITVFDLSPNGWPGPLVAGPDGNVWFTIWRGTFNSAIGKITPSGTITEFNVSSVGNGEPRDLTVGPDGKLWFTASNAIGRLSTAGELTSFSGGLHAGNELGQIISGPDGNLWFTDLDWTLGKEPAKRDQFIGRITPTGVITEFPTTDASRRPVLELLSGPDGNVWFRFQDAPAVGRITPSGAITNFSEGLSAFSDPADLAVGPGGNDIWFTDLGAIGRVSTVGSGVSPKPRLTVMAEGSGTVTSAPAGINCGSVCVSEFNPGAAVTLTATPAPGFQLEALNNLPPCVEDMSPCFATCLGSMSPCGNFFTWQEGRDCTGPTPCALTVRGDARVSAVFVPAAEEPAPGGGPGQPTPSNPLPPLTGSTPKAETKKTAAQRKAQARRRALKKCRKLKSKAKRRCIKRVNKK
jgi:streptogramin lyase